MTTKAIAIELMSLLLVGILQAQRKSEERGAGDCGYVKESYNYGRTIGRTGEWELVFSDEFEDSVLDMSRWQLRPWAEGSFGSSQEYNTLRNIEIRNGVLYIIVKEEPQQCRAIGWEEDEIQLSDGEPNLRTYRYSSSNIWSRKSFQYGKFEARIKTPKGRGLWPAFWLFGDNPWNEIDIFEFWNMPGGRRYNAKESTTTIHTTVHYDYDGDRRTNMCTMRHRGEDYSEDFHIYTLIWEEESIEWLIDGVSIRKYYKYLDYNTEEPVKGAIQAFHKGMQYYWRRKVYPEDAMNLILNVAVQSGSDSPDRETQLPVAMEVDWVRCYERK